MRTKYFAGFLFDLDRTLIDTADLIARSFRQAAIKVLGSAPKDTVLLANVGKPLMIQMELLGGPRHAQELYDAYRQFNHARHDDFIREFPGIRDMLSSLRRRGAKMAIVTSKSRETVAMAFRVIPIEHYFDIVITTDDSQNHKPHPQPLLLAMDYLDLTPPECIYIGDSPFDLEAGQAAGMATGAVDWGMFTEVRLKEMEPDFYFVEPWEILDLYPEEV